MSLDERYDFLQIKVTALNQHNFVNGYLETEEANPRRPPISQTLYEADLPAILQNLRHDTLLPKVACRHKYQNHLSSDHVTKHAVNCV